jgi:hypothetical protein
MISGALLFGHYAFPPNRLGYCGPDDHQALFQYVVAGQSDGGLLDLGRRFEGAYPYLRLIALANGIADPFDIRVVEAYWLGNRWLDNVDAQNFYASLSERFKARIPNASFRWLTSKLGAGAKPHHNFHVFDVYKHAGLMRDERAGITMERMDQCRISWGTVIAVDGPELVVERAPIELHDGKLALGAPITTRVMRQLNGLGFADEAAPGDVVAMHWDWVCQKLTTTAMRRLRHETMQAMTLANLTM